MTTAVAWAARPDVRPRPAPRGPPPRDRRADRRLPSRPVAACNHGATLRGVNWIAVSEAARWARSGRVPGGPPVLRNHLRFRRSGAEWPGEEEHMYPPGTKNLPVSRSAKKPGRF
ncbi:hypothetical protein Sliba_09690 [Streptomyces nigrescens]|uniref:Uncharacterized protein n=1 Tax=Streptomyces nigrescens TaxID=1920 RepID=A0A640TE08_STRNI|nr:hypothetical protein Sliba_09690 [Streptomyces libani subsp. libani]GGV87282.1 hypothetical protein GCM10010500_07140 [Streptomyces libani subsp. libani]